MHSVPTPRDQRVAPLNASGNTPAFFPVAGGAAAGTKLGGARTRRAPPSTSNPFVRNGRAQDAKAGEVNRQGTNCTWYALRASGKRITTQPPSTTTPVTTGGGGGGYDGGGYYPP